MKKFPLAALMIGLALPAAAQQTSLLTASPIPDGAETRFCYYAGLAYSQNAYILVGGGGEGQMASGASGGGALRSTGSSAGQGEPKPLRCVAGQDGVLGWAPVASIQISQ